MAKTTKRKTEKKAAGKTPKKLGRPDGYALVEPRLAEVAICASVGMTRGEIAERLGVSRSAFMSYAAQHKELSDALKEGDDEAVQKVQGALYRKAMRGSKDGLGDVTAQIFVLKNKRPEEWRDKVEIDGRLAVDVGVAELVARRRGNQGNGETTDPAGSASAD